MTTATDHLVVRCPNCGMSNRVPRAKLAQDLRPICGNCKQPLPIPPASSPGAAAESAGPLTVTDASFAETVERSPIPVLLDLWAPWCGPCRALAPVIDQLAADFAGRVRVAKLNIDENPATASRFGVASIPTLLIIKDGREIDRIIGVQPRQTIAARLERLTA